MRAVAHVLTAAALLALAAPAVAPARSPVKLCQSTGRALAGSAQVRVYERDGDVVACSLENGRRMLLGNHWDGGSTGIARVRPLAVAGRYVAWQGYYCQPFEGCETGYFGVLDVRKGRRLTPEARDYPAIVDIALAPNGSAAWVERVGATETLHLLDPNGHAVAAEATTIRGLALSSRSTLYWTQDGVPRSAPFGPDGEPRPPEDGRPACGTPGTVLAANAWVRVWLDETVVRACSLETRAEVEIGEPYSSSGGVVDFGPFALAGRLLAWGASLCSGGDDSFSCEQELYVRDMRTRRTRTLGSVVGPGTAAGLVLKRNGSAAWVDGSGVRVVDTGGRRVIGEGHSLALSRGSTLYWTGDDGIVRSAPLR